MSVEDIKKLIDEEQSRILQRKSEIEEKVQENNIIYDQLMRNKEAVSDEAKKILEEEGQIRDEEKII